MLESDVNWCERRSCNTVYLLLCELMVRCFTMRRYMSELYSNTLVHLWETKMAIKYIPYFPTTIEGQAILSNFVRTQ